MFLTLLIPAVVAKPLPPDAARVSTIEAGTPFEAIALHKDDAYYRTDRRTIVGLTCVADEALTLNDPKGFYGGSATCDGGSRYFFMIALRVTGAAPPRAAVDDSDAVASVPANRPFWIAGLDPEDAYFSSAPELSGQLCVSGADGLHANAPGAYGGSALCQDGTDRYFYKVIVGLDFPPIHPGEALTITDVSGQDAYASSRTQLLGRACTAGAELTTVDGWYSGAVSCGDDKFVFYQVAASTGTPPAASVPQPAAIPDEPTDEPTDEPVDEPIDEARIDEPARPSSTERPDLDARYTGSAVQNRTSVRIVNIAPEDGWAFQREKLVGQTCKVKDALTSVGDGWYQGLLVCSGSQLAFSQVAITLR